MKQLVLLVMIGVATLVAVSILRRTSPMTENEKYLKEAQAKIKEFENELESERLREASMALENVSLAKEYDPKIRAQLRKNCLGLWLEILRLLDHHLDPKFNPDDTPEEFVEPPPLSNGVVLRPGADPAKIGDPKLRAEYEAAIAENRAKINNYRLQTQLHRLNDRIPPRAEAFIRKAYSASPEDQAEVKSTIEKTITNPARRDSLLKLLEAAQS